MTKYSRLAAYLLTCFIGLFGFGLAASSTVSAQEKELSLQVVSYLTESDAQAEVARLKNKKLDAYWVKAQIPGMGTRYRVRIGRYSDEQSAMLGAANACNQRAINQFLVATGDSVPTGVRAKNCAAASAYLNGANKPLLPTKNAEIKSTEMTAKNAVKMPPQNSVVPMPKAPLLSATAKPVLLTPDVKSAIVTPEKTSTKSKTLVNNSVDTRIVTKGISNDRNLSTELTKVGLPVNTNTAATSKNAKLQNSLLPKAASEPVTKKVAVTAPSNASAAANAPMLRADKPKEIVANAFQYAATKAPQMANGLAAKNNTKMNVAMPNAASATEDLSNNPKWKVSKSGTVTDKNLRAVYFVDAWNGWAAGDGGMLYQTNDGGKQWNEIRSAAIAGKVVDVNKIYFINESKGWMLADTRASKNDDPQTVLLATEDGGQIWQNIPMPNVTSFYFANEKKGWAVGKNGTMLKTTDGGIRWKQVENLNRLLGLPTESAASNFGFSDIYFLNSDVGWAVGNFYTKVSANIGGLFMTMDGGETWQRIPLAIQRKTPSTRFTKGRLQTVRFSNISNGTITGEIEEGSEKYFFTLKTVNGGETWEQTRVPAGAAFNTQFVDDARGWTAAATARAETSGHTVYDTVLFHTANGGKSWEPDYVAHGQQIRSVFFISRMRGWAVGDGGMILRYDTE